MKRYTAAKVVIYFDNAKYFVFVRTFFGFFYVFEAFLTNLGALYAYSRLSQSILRMMYTGSACMFQLVMAHLSPSSVVTISSDASPHHGVCEWCGEAGVGGFGCHIFAYMIFGVAALYQSQLHLAVSLHLWRSVMPFAR